VAALGIGSVLALTRPDRHSTSTTAGATTAPPTAGAAPPRTSSTTVSAALATAVPTTAVSSAAASTAAQRAQLAESFLRSYYASVAARDYQRSWSMLTAQFQASTAGGYANYTSFWNTVTGIEVRRVDVQPARDNTVWPIVANLAMRYTVAGRVTDEVDQLTLDRDANGAPLISGYRVAGPG
jgi:hypothetical protein